MIPEPSDNPYLSPRSLDSPTSDAPRKVGVLGVFLIIIASIVAAWCTFFCTCVGIAIFSFDVLGNSWNGGTTAVAILSGIVAAGLAGLLVSRFLYRRMTRTKSPPEVHSFDQRQEL